jgi:2-dehydro-3-deoxy-D-arabinonate dehydratase
MVEQALQRAPSQIPYTTLDVPPDLDRPHLLQPVDAPEIWAAGVTYERSLEARIAETTVKDVYDRVYEAERPEVFFKATVSRCAGPNAVVRIRADSRWTVPEPEVGLVLDASGTIIGYTLGNDMSARDIEGANPLYLPQAKIYDACCSLGPAILVTTTPGPLLVSCRILRRGVEVFSGTTTTERMRRQFEELVTYLGQDNTYPAGTVLLTGTGIVPPDDVALEHGDIVEIASPAIGVLRNIATRAFTSGGTRM